AEPGVKAKTMQPIIALSTDHTLLTRSTPFVVVDESEVVNPDGTRRKVVQPVAMPARWEMETGIDGILSAAPQSLGAAPPGALYRSAPLPMMATGSVPPPQAVRPSAAAPPQDFTLGGVVRDLGKRVGDTIADLFASAPT